MSAPPTDFLPRAVPPCDASDLLAFWLENPLLRHHYPDRMAATARKAVALTDNKEKLLLGWRLREMALKCRTQKPLPQHLPTMSNPDFRTLADRIPGGFERSDVLHLGLRLHPCELPWLAARIETVLVARQRLTLANHE